MREIKFRAWELSTENRNIINNKIIPWEELLEFYNLENILDDNKLRKDFVIMQYTGLKDKNGTEIYEGDILELINEDEERIKCVVEFGNRRIRTYSGTIIDVQCFYFKIGDRKTNPVANNYLGKHDLEIIKVIGNIYENPELLEVRK